MAEIHIDEGALNQAVMSPLVQFTTSFVSRVADRARIEVPVRTGYLRSTISADPVRRTGPWSLNSGVSATARYAGPVHEGARPHVIRPRHARALRFEVEGRTVFAQRVNHPGNRANPFLSRAAAQVIGSDPRIIVG